MRDSVIYYLFVKLIKKKFNENSKLLLFSNVKNLCTKLRFLNSRSNKLQERESKRKEEIDINPSIRG